MNNLACTVCHNPLTGGTDTFGDIAAPMCQMDYWNMMLETEQNERSELAWRELLTRQYEAIMRGDYEAASE